MEQAETGHSRADMGSESPFLGAPQILASGYGALLAWTFLLYHSLLLFAGFQAPVNGMQLSRFVSLCAAILMLVVARYTGSSRFVSRPVVRVAAALATLGTLLIAAAGIVPQSASQASLVAGSALTGLGLVPLLLAWGRLYSPLGTVRAASTAAFATIGAGLGYFFVDGIPVQPASFLLAAVLPIASVGLLAIAEPQAPAEEPAQSSPAEHRVFRWKFAVAIFTYGMLFGLMGYVLPFSSVSGYAFTNRLSILLGTVAVVIVTAWVLLLLKRVDVNVAYSPVIPLIAIGFVLLPFLGVAHAGVATAVAYAGFACFVMFLWVVMSDMARTTGHSAVTVFSGGLLLSKAGVFVGTVFMYVAASRMRLEFAQLTAISFACLSGLGSVAALIMDGGQFAYEDDSTPTREPAPTAEPVCERCAEISERYGLSAREAEVFELLAKGRNSPFIQQELYIAKSTVETHIKHIYRKLGVSDRQELLDLVEGNGRKRK